MNAVTDIEPGATLLSNAVLAGLEKDTAEVRGLPNEAFTTESFLALEYRTLFRRSWVFAGRLSAIANPGDAEPVEVAGNALFMARDSDGNVRVFHNVCPHRGARLVIESQRETPALTCPYHAWSFDLAGALKGRPHFHGPGQHDRSNGARADGLDKVCLFEVRSATWHDWVVVNLDGNAQPFDEYIAPIDAHLDGWDLAQFEFAYHDRFEFHCNWKLAVENFSDYYHNFKVHPGMVGAAYVAEESGPAHAAGVHLSLLSVMRDPEHMFSTSTVAGLPPLPGLAEKKRFHQPAAIVFPNSGMVLSCDFLVFVNFEPVTPERSVMHLLFYFVGDAAQSAEYEIARWTAYREFEALNKEDAGICQRLQEGRSCDAYDGGRLAPFWDESTAHFHRQIANAVLARSVFPR